jgi:D-glycero-D-manno-heptose 1,7-bisphosphate phosphatase
MPKAVFLDRDGVLNEAIERAGKPHAALRPADLKIYPEAAPALARLKAAGYLLIVVTNQPDVARGEQTREAVDEMNAHLRAALPVDDVLVCWHDDKDNCPCRKPKPGMILEGAARWGVDLAMSFMVGDRWRDIDSGANAGVRTVLIDRGWKERGPDHAPDVKVSGIAEAAEWILQAGGGRRGA